MRKLIAPNYHQTIGKMIIREHYLKVMGIKKKTIQKLIKMIIKYVDIVV